MISAFLANPPSLNGILVTLDSCMAEKYTFDASKPRMLRCTSAYFLKTFLVHNQHFDYRSRTRPSVYIHRM